MDMGVSEYSSSPAVCLSMEMETKDILESNKNVMKVMKLPLSPVKMKKREGEEEEELDSGGSGGFKTPTSEEKKISHGGGRMQLSPPPPPRKPKTLPISKNMKGFNRRRRVLLDLSEEIESMFPPTILADFGNKIKKVRKETFII